MPFLTLAALVLTLAPPVTPPPASTAAEAAPVNRFGLSAPRARPDGTIRLATYNLLNLFDHVDDPALSGEHDDMLLAAAPERCAKLAEAIRAMDADVIALQEVESLEALLWFRDGWLSDLGYDHVASEDVGYYRGIECSVLSRFPLSSVRTWPEADLSAVVRVGPGFTEVPEDRREGLRFQRSPLAVDVTTPDGYAFTLFSVHHKSGRTYRWLREAEALQIITYLDAIRAADPARNIVVMGDFNAAPWDKSVRLYQEAGFVDTLAHRIIPHWRNPDETEPSLYKTHESSRVLDYVLLNGPAFRDLVVGSPHVYGTLTPPESYDWRNDPHPEGYASDHYPVIIDLVPEDRP